MTKIKEQKIFCRHKRIRKGVKGTAEQPRLCIHRSIKNMQAHVIDDISGKVLFGVSTLDKNVRAKVTSGGNIAASAVLGEAIAAKAKEKGVTKICFDRGGCLYHGRIKAFAEAARKGGLKF